MKILHKLFVEHDSVVWFILLWALTVPFYVGLQAWFGVAWKGRWRIVALIPLIGVVLMTILTVVVHVKTPDWPFELTDIVAVPIVGVIMFAPLGFIYEAIAGIARLSRRRPAAS
jgi:hypothetical protein